jgi:CBS domain containing-hemolysin-like protein
MLEWMLFRAIMVAFFILATSFFVAAEFALVSVRETRIQQLIALGRPGARTVLKLKHSIDEFLPLPAWLWAVLGSLPSRRSFTITSSPGSKCFHCMLPFMRTRLLLSCPLR